ncbi:DNA replication complex GINS protein PSF1-like [Cloeon dipterum]|uniref:DNA replication complex GINS protein PSF1 n=1 Tax=Cloeon dipterum TaxID=197152 RepID=A0A8S1CLG4_9INSE|nr:Hypothetical predicted protein [Cloeon dipterum]
MFGVKAFELIRDLTLTGPEALPLYNSETVRQVLEEMRVLYERNQRDVNNSVNEDSSYLGTVHLRHAALERNKRCLLAYLVNRLQRIRDLRWDFGSVLPGDVAGSLCEQEVQWLQNYNRHLATYMRGLDGLDLTQEHCPPKSLCLEVRCLQDYGLFELEDGEQVLLKKDSIHLLPRSECLMLIRQGVLEHIPH